MRFFLANAAILVSAVLAAPAGHAALEDLGVYVTTDWDWGNRETTGEWKLFQVQPGACQSLGGTVFDKSISSFGPNDWIKCMIYTSYDCTGTKNPEEVLPVVHPGFARLGNLNWEDKISSFSCNWVD